jgi:hypothetical protein
MTISVSEVDYVADRILLRFSGAPVSESREIRPLDVDTFAGKFLNLSVWYTRLSDSGALLGVTTYADTEITLARFSRTKAISVPKNTVLIDLRLRDDGENARRRFTLVHECAHQILFRMDPYKRQYAGQTGSLRELGRGFDWEEQKANALAAALLMPQKYIALLARRFLKDRRLISFGGRFNRPDRLALTHICKALGVSREAAVIRLRQFGYVKDMPERAFFDPTEMCADG